jgi:TRAP-type uncharacterized transport system fused permease subunit
MDFALSLTGHTRAGRARWRSSPACSAPVSGSAVANVMVDGPITIPLMKRSGFRPPFAAGVEAVASTGGQIMPPIMGAAAFVMAEFLAVPYFQVALWAVDPGAALLRRGVRAVHFEAKRYRLAGPAAPKLPRSGTCDARARAPVHPDPDHAGGLFGGYSAPLCALVGALACLPVALLRATTRAASRWRSVLDALLDGARNALAVAMACACAGIVIGVIHHRAGHHLHADRGRAVAEQLLWRWCSPPWPASSSAWACRPRRPTS